ncbi:hypothetical protein [Rhodopseudomonas palustris]|uniref:hypothetical protein n=1 Tax=Rhodopseudomonas palustris TaxID=1076 RepID=UPI0005A194F6|nr:hypothetical protein [Rhodopseudomonas palustris]
MRNISILLFLALSGCVTAPRQQVAAQLGAEYIGQNVDVMVAQFGPPTNSFKMNSGGSSYVWQLSAQTDIEMDGGSGTASTRYCKVSVVTASDGRVIDLRTEDAVIWGGIVNGGITSMCARRLGIRPQST